MQQEYVSFYDALWGDLPGSRSIWFGEKGTPPNRSSWFKDNASAISFINALDKNLFNIYHACSLFKSSSLVTLDADGNPKLKQDGKICKTSGRQRSNFLATKAIWLDLDLDKAGDSFTSVSEMLPQMASFKDTPLAGSSWIIASGHGLHFYWIFKEYLTLSEWDAYSKYLKSLCRQFNILGVDLGVVGNVATLLRVFGTKNLKETPVEVKLLKQGKLLPKFIIPENAPVSKKQKIKYDTEDFNLNKSVEELGHIPSDAVLVAEKCAVIREFTSTGFDDSEPMWYASLSVVRLCNDGIELAHEYSSKSPRYNEEETAKKLQQLSEKDIGPCLCETFQGLGYCQNCPFIGKIKSPIQLGATLQPLENLYDDATDEKEYNRVKELISLAPSGNWKVGKEGIFKFVDDVPVLVSIIPFFILDLICEDVNDLTVVTAVIKSFRGDKVDTFKLPLKVMGDDKRLMGEFNARRIFPTNKKYLKEYLALYVLNLNHVIPQQAINSLGWQGEDVFVFNSSGEGVTSEGERVNCVLDYKMRGYVAGYGKKGTLQEWASIIDIYDSSALFLPHLFSLLCSLGTPLLPLTSAKGFMLSLQGASGTGKTLSHKVALSCWGNPEHAGYLGNIDTPRALVGRIAVVKNLPVRIDEATAMSPKQLTGLIFELVNGRGRARATADGSLSNTAFDWQTLTLVTTNRPLLEQDMSIISEAERCRVLELFVEMPIENLHVIGPQIGRIMEKNYGVIAEPFINFVVQNRALVEKMITDISEEFQKLVSADKRFWITCGAIAFAAAKIALKLNLFRMDYKKCYDWFISVLKEQTLVNADAITMARGFETRDEFIHALMDSLAGHIVTLNSNHEVIKSPEREIKARVVEINSSTRILYVRTQPVKSFVNKFFVESYNKVLQRFNIDPSRPYRFKDSVMRCFEFKL
jgi:hypothetical protein